MKITYPDITFRYLVMCCDYRDGKPKVEIITARNPREARIKANGLKAIVLCEEPPIAYEDADNAIR